MSSESDKTIFTTEEESPDTVEKCVVSHDTTMVAWFTQSGRIKLLSLKSKLVKVLGQHPDANLTVLKFSPKDVLLVSCSLDGSIKVHIYNLVHFFWTVSVEIRLLDSPGLAAQRQVCNHRWTQDESHRLLLCRKRGIFAYLRK